MNDTMRWHGNDIPKITVREDIVFEGSEIKAGEQVWLFGATSVDEKSIELKVVCEDGTELYLPEEYLKNFKSAETKEPITYQALEQLGFQMWNTLFDYRIFPSPLGGNYRIEPAGEGSTLWRIYYTDGRSDVTLAIVSYMDDVTNFIKKQKP